VVIRVLTAFLTTFARFPIYIYFMKKPTLIVLLLLIAKILAYAEVRDSVQIEDVTVTGVLTETNIRTVPLNIDVVGRRAIEQRIEPSLLPIITEEVAGLFTTARGIMGYGVSTGSAGGMSVRGIGGSPTTGVLLLIDGHPQYMGMMGHPLPDAYQSLMAERVEVALGPASALYGSNAMGGVINIVTKKNLYDGINTNARLMYGSYNTATGEISNAVRKGKFSSYIAVGYNRTDGHRENLDFAQYNGYGKFGYDFSEHWNSFVDVSIVQFDASNPGTADVPMIDNDAEVLRGMTSVSVANKYERTSGAVKLFYNFGNHDINDGYKRDGGSPLPNRFHSQDYAFGATVYQSLRLFAGNDLMAKFDYTGYGGHAWNTFVNGAPNVDMADKTLNEVAGYVGMNQSLFEKVTLNAGVRLDYNEHVGAEWIPQAGISWYAAANTTLKATVGKGFRNPTIREMYMFPPQNPDLRPERLVSYEVSATQYLLDKDLMLKAAIYYINGNNSIQTVMTGGVPQNINTGEIENYGAEVSSQYAITPQLNVAANYAYLNMRNKVLAAPEHKLHLGINFTQGKWTVGTGLQHIANLYTNVAPGSEQKESFTLWNARVSYRVLQMLSIFVKGENLLNRKYEINAGYPMPRATFYGGINLHF
jgi:iron complex outermembrane receptor protein